MQFNNNDGCISGDFGGFSSGSIALIERGNCFFSDKVLNAAAAGAIGALIYDNIDQTLISVTHQDQVTIPSLFITNALGLELARLSQVPEPATLALMGLGLAGIGWRRKKAA